MTPVLVTTEFRGVFFGFLDGEEGEVVVLRDCRNCLSWSTAMQGVFGLAVYGPDAACRIGPCVNKMTLRKVTAIVSVTEEAVLRWQQAVWPAS